MIICKEVKFDCAHMLSYYTGKCSNLHGHTYHGIIRLEGITGEDCMLVDYNKIKEHVDELDHAVIFSSAEFRNEAEEELLALVQKHGMRHVVLPSGKSTAETISQYLAEGLSQYGKATVRLSETDGSWAEAYV